MDSRDSPIELPQGDTASLAYKGLLFLLRQACHRLKRVREQYGSAISRRKSEHLDEKSVDFVADIDS